MGHAGLQVTKDVYGHTSLDAQRATVARLAPIFPDAPGWDSLTECRIKSREELEQGEVGELWMTRPMVAQQVWRGGTPGGIRTPDP